jgi:capsular polysaccharide export protein
MHSTAQQHRHFLFLQGPHGGFFSALAARLKAQGHSLSRINFNGGDKGDWTMADASPFTGAQTEWSSYLALYLFENNITDIVFYGYWRPLHKTAIDIARKAGIRLHGFEEGLLRPYWITMDPRLPCEQVADLAHQVPLRAVANPVSAVMPDMPQNISVWWMLGACLRHYINFFRYSSSFSSYRTHRIDPPLHELKLWTKNVLKYPWRKIVAEIRLKKALADKTPFFLLCLQLDGDSQIRKYSDVSGMAEVIEKTIASFAAQAPAGTRLIIKKHPLDNNAVSFESLIRRLARENGVAGRVVFIEFGKLAGALKEARGMVTVNSSAGLQALFHNCPVKTLGLAAYNIPGLADDQPLNSFWQNPQKPDPAVYQAMQDILLATSQYPGNFYMPQHYTGMIDACLPVMLAPETYNSYAAARLRRYA